MHGRLEWAEVASDALRGNPLGDPARRVLRKVMEASDAGPHTIVSVITS